ncbi:Uncharacterised protein [Citrobacter freundii]|nr:Uncharacterised protein [Citrobacter freundii]
MDHLNGEEFTGANVRYERGADVYTSRTNSNIKFFQLCSGYKVCIDMISMPK